MTSSDERLCASLANTYARTFALASRLLPPRKRRGAFALYAVCRTADDIVDRAPDGSDPAASRRLDDFATRVARATHGQPDGPIERELAWACRTFDVPSHAIDELLAGVARDLDGAAYETWDELQRYCEGVASSVGEMCVSVFGVTGREAERRQAVRAARTLGVAMQLTNIVRDVGEDALRGRCYLPSTELAAFGFSRDDVLRGLPLSRMAPWSEAMQFQISRARELYRSAIPHIGLLSPDAQGCARACASGYARILEAIEANGYDNLTKRARVAWPARARVLFDAWRGRAPALPGDGVGAAVA